MSTIRWSPDLRGVAARQVHDAGADALYDAVGYLREEADRTTPIEEAVLVGSGGVDVDEGSLQGSVYYDTPYAVVQHEDLSMTHDPGRRGKWLALTLQERAVAVAGFLAARMRGGIR